MLRSGEPLQYESADWVESTLMPGVKYLVRRVSLALRAEITRRVKTLLAELEYREAGDGLDDRLSAALVAAQVDLAYLDWGLARVEGLEIDGQTATVQAVLERGPEALSREIAKVIRDRCQLTEPERKN
jgi:hypothetical protein